MRHCFFISFLQSKVYCKVINPNSNAKNIMHPETSVKLKELLVILNDQGEEAAFEAVRKLVKENKY